MPNTGLKLDETGSLSGRKHFVADAGVADIFVVMANENGTPVLALVERNDSTTCPRAMLCDWNIELNGRPNGRNISRCNLEGYGGVDWETYGPEVRGMLAQMPGGRCPYPPGDRPGILGFDKRGHYVGPQT